MKERINAFTIVKGGKWVGVNNLKTRKSNDTRHPEGVNKPKTYGYHDSCHPEQSEGSQSFVILNECEGSICHPEPLGEGSQLTNKEILRLKPQNDGAM